MNRLRDRAYAEAHALRSEAIGEFWRGANLLRLSAIAQAERAGRRLAARLNRRDGALRSAKTGEALP
jgi:hypothetical protein